MIPRLAFSERKLSESYPDYIKATNLAGSGKPDHNTLSTYLIAPELSTVGKFARSICILCHLMISASILKFLIF